jgi:hypothetical protein
MIIVGITILPNNELTAQQIKFIETSKSNKYRETEFRGQMLALRDGSGYKFRTDTLKGPRDKVPWAASRPRTLGLFPYFRGLL